MAGSFLLGCSLVLGCVSPKNSVTATTQPAPLSGQVIFLRGGVFGIFSSGFDSLAEQLKARGMQVVVSPHDEYEQLAGCLNAFMNERGGKTNHLILIGHSWGADDGVRLASKLNAGDKSIDLFIAIDPTETQTQLPASIKRSVNIYQSNGAWYNYPWFRGQRYNVATTMNINLWDANNVSARYPRLCHWNLTDQPAVREQIVALIEQTCAVNGQEQK